MNPITVAKMLSVGLAIAVAGGRASAALVDSYNFDESNAGSAPAIDSVSGHNGIFQGTATRTNGLNGSIGAALFNNTGGDAVDVGPTFAATTGIDVQAVILPSWNPGSDPYDEIFRKEDGNNRILFSFQNDANGPGAQPPVATGPVLSFGLNIGGSYNELDMLLDGSHGVTLNTAPPPGGVELEDGKAHQVDASYDSATGVKAIYVDGILRDSVLVSGTITSGGAVDATIGNVGPGGGEPFTGVIDSVKLYNNALVPEPASAAVLAVSGALLMARRRNRAMSR